jgi:hypothetical protein
VYTLSKNKDYYYYYYYQAILFKRKVSKCQGYALRLSWRRAATARRRRGVARRGSKVGERVGRGFVRMRGGGATVAPPLTVDQREALSTPYTLPRHGARGGSTGYSRDRRRGVGLALTTSSYRSPYSGIPGWKRL